MKTLKRFNNNWRRSPVGFLLAYVSVSDEKLSFNLTQILSKSPEIPVYVDSSCYLSIIFANIGKLDGSKHSEVIEWVM